MNIHSQAQLPDSNPHRNCKVIGIPIVVGSLSSVSKKIFSRISEEMNRGGYICVANVHMLSIAHRNPKLKLIMESSTHTVADGMPLVWMQKFHGYSEAERVCGPDLMLELCKLASESNKSVYLLGSTENTLSLLSQNLKQQFPNLQIVGANCPGKLSEPLLLNLKLVGEINESGASLLFVGLGCPKQEFWCALHAPHLKPLALGVGAAFDFHAGTKKRPPLIIQKCGLEWLYRLLSEPRRLGARYITSNTHFLYLCLKEQILTKLNIY